MSSQSTPQPTARILPSSDSKGIYLVIDRGVLAERIACAIMPDEVEAIRNACNEWLENESQEIMKGSL